MWLLVTLSAYYFIKDSDHTKFVLIRQRVKRRIGNNYDRVMMENDSIRETMVLSERTTSLLRDYKPREEQDRIQSNNASMEMINNSMSDHSVYSTSPTNYV